MSHEATHVATGASFATVPTWLLEGFADYVALDDAGVPVDVAAAQALERIREDGLPDRLPTGRPRPDGQRARRDLRAGLAGLPVPGPGVRHRAAGAVLPRRSATGARARGVPQVLGTTQAQFVRALAGRPAPLPGWQAERVTPARRTAAGPAACGSSSAFAVSRPGACSCPGTGCPAGARTCRPERGVHRAAGRARQAYASTQRHLGWASLAVSLVVGAAAGADTARRPWRVCSADGGGGGRCSATLLVLVAGVLATAPFAVRCAATRSRRG